MSVRDCQKFVQRATEAANEDASMNHMPDLLKADVVDDDVSRRTTKLAEKGLQ